MIREIEISNFQSLRKLLVRPGRFTVITGRTGTGKSAFIRAVKLAAFNASGKAFVSRGQKTCAVAVSGDEIEHTGLDDDFWCATITRGAKDSYQLGVGINQKTYTKLAGKVPEAATQVLRLGEINFAGQFDRPYLLAETGGQVSRVLGELTNVTMLHRAAAEANRRRLGVLQVLRTRHTDLEKLAAEAVQYDSLPHQGSVVEWAEAAQGHIAELERSRYRLGTLIDSHNMAKTVLAAPQPPAPPSLDKLTELTGRWERLVYLIGQHDQSSAVLRSAQDYEAETKQAVGQAQSELDEYVAQWGVCPTCGQPVNKSHEPH